MPFTVQGYTVTPLEADHDLRTQPVIYLIERNGVCLLYANDTGYFPESTWNLPAENLASVFFDKFGLYGGDDRPAPWTYEP